jgi:membrane protein required for colicin V production
VISIVALGFLNRLAGGIFGLLKAALVLSVILYFINGLNPGLIKSDVKDSSILYDPIESIVPMLIPRLDLDEIGFPEEAPDPVQV